MKNLTNLKSVLAQVTLDKIEEELLSNVGLDDYHHVCFNTDHYVIYTSEAKEFIAEYFEDSFEAINFVQDYEIEMYGEHFTKIDEVSIVNMIVYIVGEELFSETGLYEKELSLGEFELEIRYAIDA